MESRHVIMNVAEDITNTPHHRQVNYVGINIYARYDKIFILS